MTRNNGLVSRLLLSALVCGSPAHAITLGSGGDAKVVDMGQTFDPAADRHAAAQAYVVTAGPGKFEKMRKVAILNFCTQFVYSKSARGTSSGASVFYKHGADGGIDLDLARMTQVSNDLYDQLEAGLRAAGLELVPYETLAANPAYQKFARDFVTEPQDVEAAEASDRNSHAYGRAVVISAKGRPFSTDCRAQVPARTGARVQLAHQLKDVHLLSVNTVVDFGAARTNSGLMKSAKADIEYGQFIVPGETQYHFTGLPQPLFLNVWLKQAVVPAQSPFIVGESQQTGTTKEKVETAAETTTTRTTFSEREVDFNADLYYQNAASHLQAVNEMFLDVLKNH
jgi:hypothetical protein